MLTAGVLFHSLLPRVFAACFSAAPVRPMDDDWHQIVQNKVARATQFLTRDDTAISSVVSLVTTAPVEHLMRRIQFLDHRGMSLDAVTREHENPFAEALRSFRAMLVEPLRLDTLGIVFMAHGGSQSELMGTLRAAILGLAAQVWAFFELRYKDFPYRLVALADCRRSDDERLRLATEFLNTPDCCLDKDFSLKVRALGKSLSVAPPPLAFCGSSNAHGLVAADLIRAPAPPPPRPHRRPAAQVKRCFIDEGGGPAQVLAHEGLMSALRMWAARGKLSNMHTERLLRT